MLQCFTALLVSDEQEEEETQEEESEQHPEHAADTSDGIYKIKAKTNTLNITLFIKHITHECVFSGGSEFSLKLMMPDQISLEAFTCDILGFSPLPKKSGSPSSQE